MKASRVALCLLAVLVLAAAVLGRLAFVRVQYGEWGLAPSSSPPTISFEGRDGRRGHRLLARRRPLRRQTVLS